MKFNKKAETTGPQIVATIVIILAAFIVTYVAIIEPLFISKGPSTFGDQMCRGNAALDNGIAVGDAHPVSLWFCSRREVEIDANNWDKCNPQYKQDYETAKENNDQDLEIEAQKKCAAQQVADLADRCYYMLGKGKWNFFALNAMYDNCFEIKVKNIGQNQKISENFLKNVVKEQKFKYGITDSRIFFKNEIIVDKWIPMKFCDYVKGTHVLCAGDAVCIGNGCQD